MKKENILVVVLVTIALAGLFWFFTARTGPQNPGVANGTEPVAAAQIPAVEATGNAGVKNGNAGGTSGIDWKNYTPGLAQAKTRDKNVFLYFYAQWCTYCTQLKKTTFVDEKVLAYLEKNFVSISVDTDQNQTLSQTWQVKGLPTMWFLTSDGKRISSLPGYVDGPQFLQILRYIHTKSYDEMSFQDFVKS
ncbi:MAG TPA: thioredoxin fold domain-containing protein [Desulfotignum sp.]|nr:thioredoxin fold domain-containing protein [Desulfotignum sp.]